MERRKQHVEDSSIADMTRVICWAEARLKIARMTLTIKLDGNWSSFQLANSAPPLSVTDSALAPSARMQPKHEGQRAHLILISTFCSKGFAAFLFLYHCLLHIGLKRNTSCRLRFVGRSSQANYLKRNSAMDDSIGGS